MLRGRQQVFVVGALVLLVLASLIGAGASTPFAGQDGSDAPGEAGSYSLESLKGNYAVVGTYAGMVASDLGVLTFDGLGRVKGSAIVNQPDPDGLRAIIDVSITGTYSVKSDGTGTMSLAVALPDGSAPNVTEDFVITKAESQRGTLLATSIFDAQEQPSVILSGNVFVTHTYTRRPD